MSKFFVEVHTEPEICFPQLSPLHTTVCGAHVPVGEPDGSFGVAAGIQDCAKEEDSSTSSASCLGNRNVKPLLDSVMNSICSKAPEKFSIEVTQMVSSLLLPFLARRSIRQGEWFTRKDYNRVVNCFERTCILLEEIRSEFNPDAIQKFVKYHLNLLAMKFFNHERDVGVIDFPEALSKFRGRALFSGFAKLAIHRALGRNDFSFGASLLKGIPQAWGPLSEEMSSIAKKTHEQRFTTDHGEISDRLFTVIRVISREIFRDIRDDNLYTKFCPSQSACLQANREHGGATKLFAEKPLSVSFPEVRLDSRNTKVSCLIRSYAWNRYDFDPTTIDIDDDLSYRWCRARTLLEGSPQFPSSFANQNAVAQWRIESLRTSVRSVFDRVLNSDFGGVANMQVVALPEPGKYRIITKGDGFLFAAVQPLQGAMIQCWKRSKHSSMRHDDLTEKVQLMDVRCGVLPYFCSVDYEAATDLLKKVTTVASIEGLLDCSVKFRELLLLAFLPGDVFYGKKDGPSVKGIDAQPMGHPLSFPLLCTINLAVLKYAVELWIEDPEHDPELPLEDRSGERAWSSYCNSVKRGERILWGEDSMSRAIKVHFGDLILETVLVNGDDMLFKTTKLLFKKFCQASTEAGLKASAGKNYFSRNRALINSQFYQKNGDGKVVRCGYLNQRLTTGNNIKQESICTPEQVGQAVNQMIARCPWTQCVIPMVFSRWDKLSTRFVPNWYLPVHAGGYGVKSDFAPEGWKISLEQRKMAHYCLQHPSYTHHRVETLLVGTENDRVRKLQPYHKCEWEWFDSIERLFPFVGEFDEYRSLVVTDEILGSIPESRFFEIVGFHRHSDLEDYESYSVYLRGLGITRDVYKVIRDHGTKEHRKLLPLSLEKLKRLQQSFLVTTSAIMAPKLRPLNSLLFPLERVHAVREQLSKYQDSASKRLEATLDRIGL